MPRDPITNQLKYHEALPKILFFSEELTIATHLVLIKILRRYSKLYVLFLIYFDVSTPLCDGLNRVAGFLSALSDWYMVASRQPQKHNLSDLISHFMYNNSSYVCLPMPMISSILLSKHLNVITSAAEKSSAFCGLLNIFQHRRTLTEKGILITDPIPVQRMCFQ